MNETKISPLPAANDLMTRYAERAAREAGQRAEARRLELAEQRSVDKPPSVRIRIWEKVHALRLAPAPEHPILYVIATGTGLTLGQVRDEQRTRLLQHHG